MTIFASSCIFFHNRSIGLFNKRTLCTVVVFKTLVLFNRFISDWDSHCCRLRHPILLRWLYILLMLVKLHPQQYFTSVDVPDTLPDLSRVMILVSAPFGSSLGCDFCIHVMILFLITFQSAFYELKENCKIAWQFWAVSWKSRNTVTIFFFFLIFFFL